MYNEIFSNENMRIQIIFVGRVDSNLSKQENVNKPFLKENTPIKKSRFSPNSGYSVVWYINIGYFEPSQATFEIGRLVILGDLVG